LRIAPINILFSSGMHTPFLKSAFARHQSLITFGELQQFGAYLWRAHALRQFPKLISARLRGQRPVKLIEKARTSAVALRVRRDGYVPAVSRCHKGNLDPLDRRL
jgi:hypothetical protein